MDSTGFFARLEAAITRQQQLLVVLCMLVFVLVAITEGFEVRALHQVQSAFTSYAQQSHWERGVPARLLMLQHAMTDAESSVRAFALSGREQHLERYQQGVPRVSQLLADLRTAWPPEPPDRGEGGADGGGDNAQAEEDGSAVRFSFQRRNLLRGSDSSDQPRAHSRSQSTASMHSFVRAGSTIADDPIGQQLLDSLVDRWDEELEVLGNIVALRRTRSVQATDREGGRPQRL